MNRDLQLLERGWRTARSVALWFFFFQAEDGIRDGHVTGVQTCALPIWVQRRDQPAAVPAAQPGVAGSLPLSRRDVHRSPRHRDRRRAAGAIPRPGRDRRRSEEHTSELQSRGHLVCRLLLEKKKKTKKTK